MVKKKDTYTWIQIIQLYFILKVIFIVIGIVIFLLNIPFPSYLTFLLEDAALYTFSIFVPIAFILGYLYCVLYLPLQSNVARIMAILLSIFPLFYFPIGTFISIAIIGDLVYYSKDFFPDIAKKIVPFRVIGTVCIVLGIVGILFSTGIVADFQRDIGYGYLMPLSISDFDEDTSGEVDVIIQMKGLGISAISTQNVMVQQIETLGGEVKGTTFMGLNTINAIVDKDDLIQIASNPNVVRIIPNEKVEIIDYDINLDYTFLLDDSYSLLNTQPLLDRGITGEGIVVAIIDTGINEDMEWLQRDGVSVVVDSYELYGDWVHSHGTACASCIASQHPEYKGMAPGCSLLDVEVFQADGTAWFYDIMDGWEWVINWKIANNKFVICSNSFGAPSDGYSSWSSPDMLSEFANNMATRYNIPMIVAAGNEGPEEQTIDIPGQAEHVFTVGATNDDLVIASFSSRGPTDDGNRKPNVVAPGIDIRMFNPQGTLVYGSGTSFSTPSVAGVVALMAQGHESHDYSQFYESLERTARDLGYGGFDYDYGYGFVNAEDAYNMLDGQMPLGNYNFVFSAFVFVGFGISIVPEYWRRKS